MPYNAPDELAHVFAFAYTEEDAQRIADMANREGATRRGKFVPGTFVVSHIEGRLPAVTGTLTGNDPQESK